jgi:hypothetical protein
LELPALRLRALWVFISSRIAIGAGAIGGEFHDEAALKQAQGLLLKIAGHAPTAVPTRNKQLYPLLRRCG